MADLKAVIFDYYETLVALVKETRERVFDELARSVGVELAPGEAYRQWRQLTLSDAAVRLGGARRPPPDGAAPPFISFADAWTKRFEELFERWGVDAPATLGTKAQIDMHSAAVAYPEAPQALDALRGRYRLAVLSDADIDFLDASMRRNGFSFETVVSSEEVRAYKPHISIFREACARLGVEPSEAVYVGDSPWPDVEGARHAGLRAVWIDRHGAAWPEDIEPPQERVTALAELAGLLS